MKVNLVPRSFHERGESGNDVVIKTSVQDMIGSLGAAQRNGAKKSVSIFMFVNELNGWKIEPERYESVFDLRCDKRVRVE